MTTDFRALCAELSEALCGYTISQDDCLLVTRARALLDQPVAEGPTDDEIYKLALEGDFLVNVGDCYTCMVQDEVEFARAVLAKWGHQ